MEGGNIYKVIMLFIWFVYIFSCSSWYESFLRNHAVDAADMTTARISGPDGNCIRVYNGDYRNRNHITLSPCESTSDFMWTFGSDGTLQFNGSCLTVPYGFNQGSYVMIYNCKKARKNAMIWELRNHGEIWHPPSGLVLTADTGKTETRVDPEGVQEVRPHGASKWILEISRPVVTETLLTLEDNVSSSFQTWRHDNHTEPNLVSIIGYNNLCIQATENEVVLAECDISAILEQRWLLYPGGTIRPQWSSKLCLSYDNLTDNKVVVVSCGLALSSQRWVFKNHGTILNPISNLVMEAINSTSINLMEFIVLPFTGIPHQKWATLPL